MYKNLLTFFFLYITQFLHAQYVIIAGAAKTYEQKEISLWVNVDYISNTQRELARTTIDSAGFFSLQFKIKEIQYATLKVENYISSLYIEPDENYELKLFPADSTVYQNKNVEHPIKNAIKLKSRTEINALTIDYDNKFDAFLEVDYLSFVKRTPQAKIDSFKLAVREYYSTVNNSYFDAYITYSIASLEEKTNMNEKKLFDNYIYQKPILYTHPEYMHFFNTFYNEKIQVFSLSKAGDQLKFQINDRGSFSGAMSVLKLNKYLQNDTIRELVLIKTLYESYYNGSFKKGSILAMLQQIIDESKMVEHKQIAQNCLNSFSKLKKGSLAPYFELPDKTGKTHSLDQLRSQKYVYLMFFDEECTACLQQMKIIPALKKKYGEGVVFVSISNHTSNEALKNFCSKNPKYDWLFLYDNSVKRLRNDYEIKSLPAYFLINPEGKFLQVPADSPDENIEQVFSEIVKPKKNNKTR